MNGRCRDKGHSKYGSYGGKGIRVCQEWVASFDAFRSWALANSFYVSLSLDRINPNGNYEPGNCQWIPIEENRAKAIRAKGEDHYKAVLTDDIVLDAYKRKALGESIASVAKNYGVSQKTLAAAVRGENWKHIKAIIDSGVLDA